MSVERRLVMRTAAEIAVVVALTAALRLPLLGLPLERDEGGYVYIAWRLDLGELPYRDWFDQKPPGIFWAYRSALALPFDPVAAIRVVAALFSAATGVALLFAARRFVDRPWALCAAVLFVFLSADPGMQGPVANTERFMLLPLVLAHLLFLRFAREGSGGRPALLAIGALLGLATSFKQVAAVDLLFFAGAYPLLVPAERRSSGPLTFAVLVASGMALVWAAIAAYFAARGGLAEFLEAVLLHNLRYAQALSLADRIAPLARTLARLAYSQSVVWGVAAVGVAALSDASRRWALFYLLGWLAASAVGISASGYYFPHYFQQAAPPVALLAAAGAASLAGTERRAAGSGQGPQRFARGAAVTTALLAAPIVNLVPYLLVYTPEHAIRAIYPGNPFEAMPGLARRVAEITPPGGTVFVFGAEPEIFFYARRRSASRYIYLFPLYGPYPDVRRRQELTMQEIIASRPGSAVFLPNDLFLRDGTDQYLTERIREYLSSEYEADSVLVLDASGEARLIRTVGSAAPELPAGSRAIGTVFARRRS